MQTDKMYKRDVNRMDRNIRDRGDLTRNVIHSVFEALNVEDCLADRGDAKENPTRKKTDRIFPKTVKQSIETKREVKSPKKTDNAVKKEESRAEKDKNSQKKEALTENPEDIVIEDPQIEECLLKLERFHEERRKEEKMKPVNKMNQEKSPDKLGHVKTYLDAEGRRFLRQKYTVKFRGSNKNHVEARESKLIDGTEAKKTKDATETPRPNHLDAEAKKPKETQRRPIIKTIKNNDNRTYKAVTFVNQKPVTPIQIRIPSDDKTKPNLKSKTVSKVSVQIKARKKKDKRMRRRPSASPEGRHNSPAVTEVAKWAPSCLTDHTQPYYEAWVDTTLAAVTNYSEHDKLFKEKLNIIKNFKRALEECSDTLDVYNCNDERLTGRIVVRQRS